MGAKACNLAELEPYVRALETLATQARPVGVSTGSADWMSKVLDGQPSGELKRVVPLEKRREMGAFFTGKALAGETVAPWRQKLTRQARIVDPACGAGDLLLACARSLPTHETLRETLWQWGRQVFGFDLHPEFVRVTKARLALLAAQRVRRDSRVVIPPLDQMFPNVQVGDGLGDVYDAVRPTHIVLNPPFQRAEAPDWYTLGNGLVSRAAVFVQRWLLEAESKTEFAAILPDVLRTGANYASWRAWVERQSASREVKVHGAFDSEADVDVFILRVVCGSRKEADETGWWRGGPAEQGCVGERFNVHVGSVVPHRDAKMGPWRAFVTTRVLPRWGVVRADKSKKRRYRGRTFSPPFVAIRRTSAPGDRKRAVGTIVTGAIPVAVENHLIVAEPRDGSVQSCRGLLDVLHSDESDRWFDERIRCRHLTVSAVAELPWRSW